MTEEHSTDRRRRRKVLAIVGALSLVAAVAAALYIFRAEIEGGGTTDTYTAEWEFVRDGTVPSGTGGDPIALSSPTPTVSGGDLVLPPSLSFFPGESYTFAATLESAEPARAAYVTGLNLPGLSAKGYTAELLKGCGKRTDNGSSTGVEIAIRITATEEASGSWTLPGTAGVELQPKEQVGDTAPSSCDVKTN